MALKLNPPTFNAEKSYERFRQELLAWREVTEVAKEKQGIVLALSLPENECGIREKVFDNISLTDLKKENGFSLLIEFLDRNLGKDELADSLEKFENFEDYRREAGQSVNDYISQFDQRYNKIQKKSMTLPSEILAFKLLKRAGITKEEKMLVMTGMDYSKRTDLYEQAKISLKKFLGQQAGGGCSDNQAIKLEPSFMTQCEETYFSQYYPGPGRFRGRMRFRNRGGRTGFQRGRPERNMNPTGTHGKILTCLCCGSFRHLIANCPDSYENLSKVNSVQVSAEQVVLFTGSSKDSLAELNNDARCCAVLDSACSSTVCGRSWFKGYMESLGKEDRETVVKSEGFKKFKFGGGDVLQSEGSYDIPAVLAGQAVRIRTDVVNSDIPLLLSIHSMKEAQIKLDLENDTAEILGKKVILNYTSSGHYCIPIDKHEEVPIEEVHVVLQDLREEERNKVILKLHRQFAHPPMKKLVALLKDAAVWRDDFQPGVDKIYQQCELCKIYARTPPRPAVALPMASEFNEVVAMDLKTWRRGWILHLVDMWSRLTVSVHIDRKTPSQVIDKIMTHWVGAGYGIMKGILTDNGGEFSADEMREVASVLNIRLHTTAAECPFQNGLCERIHSVTDMMLLKMQAQFPETPLNILLCWVNMARNALQMWHGYSSYQLVYGKNPNLPNIMTDTVPALEGRTKSEALAQHLNTLHSARKAFIETEACERIRRSLRSKVRAAEVVYHHGDLVYYKREGHEKWLGPGKVVFQDGKVVFVRHGGVFVRVSPNRLIKSGQELSKAASDVTSKSETETNRNGKEFSVSPHTESLPSESFGTESTVQTTTIAKQPHISLRNDDRIQWRDQHAEEWTTATVISRGGKVSGQYKNRFNVRIDGDESVISVNLEQVGEWRKLEEVVVNVVTIPHSRHREEGCVRAMEEELEKLREFDTYEEVLDVGQIRLSTRWVICQKGDKIKARLVVRGFEEDVDIQRDSPTIGKSAMRVFLAVASNKKWTVKTTDIKSAFLQGKLLDRDVFVTPPPEVELDTDKLWKLKRGLYGLNDAARQFYNTVRDELIRLGCIQSVHDPALFLLKEKGQVIGLLASHVDDFLHCGNNIFNETVVKDLQKRFQVGKLEIGQFKYIGYNIKQLSNYIIQDQAEYVNELECGNISPQRKMQKQESLNCVELTALRGLVGRLNWVVQGTRPDLSFELIELSTKFKKAVVEDLLRAMKAIRKLKEHESKVVYPDLGQSSQWKLIVFTDAAHANLCDGVSSVGAHVIFLVGEDDKCCPLAWHAGKIKRVVRSTIAAETLNLQEGIEEAFYLKRLLEEVTSSQNTLPIHAFVDNRSVVEALHSTKLVDDKRLRLDIGAIQQSLRQGEVRCVSWVPGSMQLANVMTKRGVSSSQLLSAIQSGRITSEDS